MAAPAERKDLHRTMMEAASSYDSSSIIEEIVSAPVSDGSGPAADAQFEGDSRGGGSPEGSPSKVAVGGGSSESYDTEFYPDEEDLVTDGPVHFSIANDNDLEKVCDDAVLPRP